MHNARLHRFASHRALQHCSVLTVCCTALIGCNARCERNDDVTCQSVHAEGRGAVSFSCADAALERIKRLYPFHLRVTLLPKGRRILLMNTQARSASLPTGPELRA